MKKLTFGLVMGGLGFLSGFAVRSGIECTWWHQSSNAVGAAILSALTIAFALGVLITEIEFD